MNVDDPVEAACIAFQWPEIYLKHPVLMASMRRALAAWCEAEADELTTPDMREKGTYIARYLRVRAAALREPST